MQLSCNWVLKCKSISGIASQPTLENTTEHLFFPPASRSSWTVPSPWGSRDTEPRLDFWAGDPRHVAAEVWRESWRQHYCVDRIEICSMEDYVWKDSDVFWLPGLWTRLSQSWVQRNHLLEHRWCLTTWPTQMKEVPGIQRWKWC